ncbi:MAG TPA: DUF1592 domain-containing protein [Burkholderiaceae bacterium]|nr:DUF1592 domain-containing protein [Burkholderiaceae bacterium]
MRPKVALLLLAAAPAVPAQDRPVQDQADAPLPAPFAARCADCHGADAQKGGLDLATRARAGGVDWLLTLARARDRVAAGEMPPPGEAPLAADDKAQVLAFCAATLAQQVPRLPAQPGRVTVRRLSRTQWDNTVRDLFGVQSAKSAAFPADDLGYGFDTIGDALSFSTLHLEQYLAAAKDVAAAVFDGEDPRAPAVRRVEAEHMTRVAGDGVSLDGDVAGLWTNATIGTGVALPRDGTYRLRINAGADQAGNEPARMAVALDGKRLRVFDVPQRELRVQELTAEMAGGVRRVELSFVNDFWDPKNPDPARRDRNLRIDWFELVGPLDARPLPPQRRWLAQADRPDAPPPQRLRALAAALLPRAWRRPASGAEVERIAAVGEQALRRGEAFHLAAQRALEAALVSPFFLFRIEGAANDGGGGGGGGDGATALPPAQLAVRLSCFLWSSAPDDQLAAAAADGRLRDAAGRRAQVERMLADPRAESLATDFAAQWLELRALRDRTPDPARFPCDAALKASMRRQTELLFLAVLRQRLDVRALLDCDFTFVDRRLAAFYGLDGSFGDEFVQVALPPAQRARGGLLGQASVLTVTSNPTRTSPVKRGKWILENLLGQAPPPPPPGNDSLKDEPAASTPTGLRAQMALHRGKAACAGCHLRMDALGFALERFDAIGRPRERDEQGAIDDSFALPDGRQLRGIDDLSGVLCADPAFPRTLAHKLFVFAVGRDLSAVDRLRLDLAVNALRARGAVTIADLVVAVVESDAFLLRGKTP